MTILVRYHRTHEVWHNDRMKIGRRMKTTTALRVALRLVGSSRFPSWNFLFCVCIFIVLITLSIYFTWTSLPRPGTNWDFQNPYLLCRRRDENRRNPTHRRNVYYVHRKSRSFKPLPTPLDWVIIRDTYVKLKKTALVLPIPNHAANTMFFDHSLPVSSSSPFVDGTKVKL